MLKFSVRILVSLVFSMLASGYCNSVFAQGDMPKISIIIDDLGYDEAAGARVANLPGPIVCSILPEVEFSTELANKCHAAHKEIILHTPMEALSPHRLGPGGLYTSMNLKQFVTTLNQDIEAVPFIVGINNHEGSKLTESAVQMNWVMQAIKPQGLFFIDSVTSSHSVAEKIAKQNNIPTIDRNIFLDDIPTQEAVRAQLDALLDEADERGQAVAIGHPYPATIAVLEQELPKLAQEGYQLVPVSQLVLRKPPTIEYWQLPFLQQIWRQVIASNAGINSFSIIQTQLDAITPPVVTSKNKRVPIVIPTHKENTKNIANNKIDVNKELAELAHTKKVLRSDLCTAYPKLCYLIN